MKTEDIYRVSGNWKEGGCKYFTGEALTQFVTDFASSKGHKNEGHFIVETIELINRVDIKEVLDVVEKEKVLDGEKSG